MSTRKRGLPESELWEDEDHDVIGVRTFDWKCIHPVTDTVSPWDLLVAVPFVHLERMSKYVDKEELVKYAMNEPGVGSTDGCDIALLLERVLDRNRFQGAWGNILMPPLCALRGACWADSYACHSLVQSAPIGPNIMRNADVVELAKFDVVAMSRAIDGHFYGCVVVYPRTLDHGYVLCMEPLDSGIHSDLQTVFVDIARNLMTVKYNLPPLSQGAMDKDRPTPAIKMIMVKHPAYMRQKLGEPDGDLACSFWNMIQLTHWVDCFGRLCNKDSDEFVKFLDKNLDLGSMTYDLCAVRPIECTVHRTKSLETIRYYGLLFLQYLAQYSDLKYIANTKDPVLNMRELLRNRDECMRTLERKARRSVFGAYVLAGDERSVEHYERLYKEYTDTDPQLRRKFMDELPAIDLVRFGIFKLVRAMTNAERKVILKVRAMYFDYSRSLPPTLQKMKENEICDFTVIYETISRVTLGLKNFSKTQRKSSDADGGIVIQDDAAVKDDSGTVIDPYDGRVENDGKQAKSEIQIDLSKDPA